jgi:succinate-semialdehyde dehydrogenase/glutarate-semialdehyde dehydrogenase
MIAGNVALLKHASSVPLTALEIHRLFRDCGLPDDVFQTLLIDAPTAGWLVESHQVDGVSLTGSVEAGTRVGEVAGRSIKKVVLELGGSDPFVVLDDADLDKAAQVGVLARVFNTGQSCIAAKRIIVLESVAEAYRSKFIEVFRNLKLGDPMREETDMGPLARKEFVDDLQAQLDDAVAKGAEIHHGPEIDSEKGFFFRPAVLTRVTRDMNVMTQEVFGPLVPVITARDEEEAIEIANDTELGLGASVWSRNIQRAERVAREIRSGFVAINDMVKSDPRLPFGGIKKSGVGRELSYFGLKEFVNAKTVVVIP